MTPTHSILARISALLDDGEQFVSADGPGDLNLLRIMRLAMAGAVTSFQLALANQCGSVALADQARAEKFRKIFDEWAVLARNIAASFCSTSRHNSSFGENIRATQNV